MTYQITSLKSEYSGMLFASFPDRTVMNEIYDVISIANEFGENVYTMLGEHFCNNQEVTAYIDMLIQSKQS